MRFATLAFAGLIGTLVLSSDASACHKKKCGCAAPAPVAYCAPAPVKVKMAKVKHCKKAAPVCTTVAYAPATYAAPMTYATPQATPQATMQTPPAPAKSM